MGAWLPTPSVCDIVTPLLYYLAGVFEVRSTNG
jgi:hypothetical protein